MSQANTEGRLSPQQQEAFEDIVALIALQKTTGMMTYKMQKEILATLTPHDAAVVGRELVKRVQPIYTKPSQQ
jgi:predicted NAD-dependent protein-ADP-ribosyltransferase YbiA (DUF1768 family)